MGLRPIDYQLLEKYKMSTYANIANMKKFAKLQYANEILQQLMHLANTYINYDGISIIL